MEQFISEVIKQVPALAVLAYIVITFVKFLKTVMERTTKQDERFADASEKMMGDFRETANECHLAQSKGLEAIANNSAALDRHTEVMRQLVEKLK